jgi:4-amino-4-deoxy-L-arabinose transferase-like glycosyltransferase
MIETANSSYEEGKVTSQRPGDRLSALPESLAYWGLLAVAAYSILRSVVYAAIKPFWFDEVLTYVVSRQRTPSAIWAALKQGVDGNPPTFYLLEHFAASLLPNEHIGYRLLSIVGFACALLLLFVFLKTRYGSHRALLCSSLLLITPLFTLYAEEARPYSLVAALIALAMVCYQRTPGVAWTVGLGAGLLLAALLHYYTVVTLAPFFLAELALLYFSRQIRFGVWLALALPLVPIAISWPRLMWMKQNWGPHFWAGAALSDVSAAYGAYFRVGPPWGMAICGLAILIILVPLFRRFPASDDSPLPPALIAERVLIAGLIALPLFGFAVAKIAHGPFVERYFLPSIFGFAASAALVLRSAPAKTLLAAAILVFVALSSQEVGFWKGLNSRKTVASMTAPLTKLADKSNFLDLPSSSRTQVASWRFGTTLPLRSSGAP